MKFKILAITLSLIFSQVAFAANTKLIPDTCPTVRAIKAAGVTHAFKDTHSTRGSWVAMGEINQYGTDNEWRFFIEADESVKNEQEAVLNGNEKIKALTSIFGPGDADNKGWFCMYFSNGKGRGSEGFAVTPPDILPANLLLRFKR